MDQILQNQVLELAKYGLVGTLLILAGWRIVKLEDRVSKLMDARMSDWKEIATTVGACTMALSNWTSANDARTRTLDAMVRSSELNTQAQGVLAQAVAALGTDVVELRNDTQRTREILLQRGPTQ